MATTPPTGRLLPPPPPPPPPPPLRRRPTTPRTPLSPPKDLKKFRTVQWIVIGIVIALTAIVADIVRVYTNFPAGLAAFGMMLCIFLAQGFRNFDPTTLAVPMFLGKLFDCTIGPGWEFIPLAGGLFDYRIINAERINLELDVEERTPSDNGLVRVEPFFTWQVSKNNPKPFIMVGGAEAVVQMFSERVKGRLREWITSEREGPQTWREALKSNGPALFVLIQRLFPEAIKKIPDTIYQAAPQLIDIEPIGLVRYFTGRPPLPEYKEDPGTRLQEIPKDATRLWKEETLWQKTLEDLKRDDRPTWEELQKEVKKQLAFVDCIKTGGIDATTGETLRFPIDDLGIDIVVANIAGIKPIGKTSDAADSVAEAIQAVRVNEIGSKNLLEEIDETLKRVGNDPKLAKELVELRRHLVTKNVNEQQYGLTPELTAALDQFMRWFTSRRTP